MKKTAITFLVLVTVLINGCVCLKPCSDTPQIAVLKNDFATVAIKTDAGGRIVQYKLNNGKNMLFAEPENWNVTPPKPAYDSEWMPFMGHIIWIGPQADFWTRQSKNIKKLNKKDIWPPDPYQIHGRFKIVAQTASSMTLEGPASKITGIKLSKNYTLHKDGKVSIKVTGTNIRKEPVICDLWSLVRVHPNAMTYGKIAPDSDLIINRGVKLWSKKETLIKYAQKDGYVYCPRNDFKGISEKYEKLSCKAFFSASVGFLASFDNGMVFIDRFKPTPPEQVHPNHTCIELFKAFTRPGSQEPNPVQELEFHSPYKKLQPGESITIEENWEILPYTGENTVDAHIKFLKSL